MKRILLSLFAVSLICQPAHAGDFGQRHPVINVLLLPVKIVLLPVLLPIEIYRQVKAEDARLKAKSQEIDDLFKNYYTIQKTNK